MRYSVVRNLHHDAEDAAPRRPASGVFERPKIVARPKARESKPSARDFLVAESTRIMFRAHDRANVPVSRTAELAGVSQQTASRWTATPLTHPPPLRAVLAHPVVSVEAAALMLERLAMELIAAETPAGIQEALGRVKAATTELETLIARRG